MGWAWNNKRLRPWTAQERVEPLNQKLQRLGVDGIYGRPSGRDAEAVGRLRALWDIGYEGRIDQDGYACDGPGTRLWVFSAQPGQRSAGNGPLEAEAWAWGRLDGGWDGWDDGAGPLVEWQRDRDRGER
jgi:hypothetical protein